MGIPFLHKSDDGSKGYNALMSIARLLVLLKIPFRFEALKDLLYVHPDFPNITAVLDTLKLYDVPCEASRMEVAQWHTIGTPFIAHTSDGFGNVYVIMEAGQRILVFNNSGVLQTVMPGEFAQKASGIVIRIKGKERYASHHFIRNHHWHLQHGVWLVYLLLPAIALTNIFLRVQTVRALMVQLLLLAGCWAGLFLVRLKTYPLDYDGAQIPFCTKNRFADCHSILHSRQSKIAGIDMAALSLFYFSFNLLLPLTMMTAPVPIVQVCTWIGAVSAFPFVLYSMYCQLFLFRKICKYCILIILLSMAYSMWVVSAIPFSVAIKNIMIEVQGIAFAGVTIVFALLLVWIIQLVFQSRASMLVAGKENEKWRRSLLLFQHFQSEAMEIPVIDIDGDIVLGNPASNHTLTIVISTGCSFCADKLGELLQFFNVLGGTVKIVLRFLFEQASDDQVIGFYQAYHQRRNDWDFLIWLRQNVLRERGGRYAYRGNVHEQSMIKQLQWLTDEKIAKAPLVIYDSHVLVEPYQLKDIAVFA